MWLEVQGSERDDPTERRLKRQRTGNFVLILRVRGDFSSRILLEKSKTEVMCFSQIVGW
jgi:hypothetical protein